MCCNLIEEKVFLLDLLHLSMCVVIQLYIVVSWFNLVAKSIYYSGQTVSLGCRVRGESADILVRGQIYSSMRTRIYGTYWTSRFVM